MKRILLLLIVLAALDVSKVYGAEESKPASDIPELLTLQNFAGDWDVAVSNGEFTNGKESARWILGGRFLEQHALLASEDGQNQLEVRTLYTFDTTTKSYRSWTFLSTGETSQAEMQWDEKAKTMTSVTRPSADGGRSTIIADFSEPGKEQWKFVFSDRDGNPTGGFSGVNTRRKGNDAPLDSARAIKESSERSDQLQVLDQFLGSWHTDYRLPKAEWTPEEKQGSADLVFTYELSGQFVRERSSQSDQTTSTLLFTYDADRQKYRSWWFNSQGLTSESTGRWDATSSTLFWTNIGPNEFKGTSQHRFPENGKFDWNVLVQDQQGVVMFRMEGTSVRVEEEKK